MSDRGAAYVPSPGDRVRLGGFDGPRAVIVMFKRHGDGKPYYKARVLSTGALEWPNHIVADSEGAYVRTCTDCEIRFLSDAVAEVLCPNCARPRGDGPDSRRTTGARVWRGR